MMLRRFTDEELTTRLRAGDAVAFDELYRRYAATLASYGGRLIGDRVLGEDVAQAALLNAYQALRRGSEPRYEVATDAPATEEPVAEEPVAEEPAADELAAEEPASAAPAVEETVLEKPLPEAES